MRAGYALALAAALLSACATLPRPVAPSSPWLQRAARLRGVERFSLQGRLAAITGRDGFSAGIRWQQQGSDAQIDLTAPLGFGAAHIEQHAEQLALTTSRGQHLSDAAASAELASTLGFDPPLASLRYWVLGVDDPASPAVESFDAEQRLASLDQDGWRVDYPEYQRVQDVWLPRRVTITRAALRLKLVIDLWRLAAP